MKRQRVMTTNLVVRVTPRELRQLDRAARARGLTTSGLVRALIMLVDLVNPASLSVSAAGGVTVPLVAARRGRA